MGGGLPAFGGAAIAGAIAALLIAIGSCLAWIGAEGEGDPIKGLDGDGKWTLAVGIVALVLFVLGVALRKSVVAGSAVAPAAIALAFAIWNIADKTRLPIDKAGVSSGEEDMYKEAMESIGLQAEFGLWMVLVGAVAAIAAAVFILATANRNQPRPYGR